VDILIALIMGFRYHPDEVVDESHSGGQVFGFSCG
jgi:hypothetical protein